MTTTTLNSAIDRVTADRPESEWQSLPSLDEPGFVEVEAVPEDREFDTSVPGLVELILKNRPRLEWLIRDQEVQSTLVPRLLLISLCSFLLFGVAIAVTLDAAGVWPHLTALSDVFSAADEGRAVSFLKMNTVHNGSSR